MAGRKSHYPCAGSSPCRKLSGTYQLALTAPLYRIMAYHWMWLPITGLYLMNAYFLFNLHGKNNYVHQALGLEK
ncbi:MAG TPA: hypothetical protein IAA57_13040 [Candidatus Pullilachnospira intestinigallinarum]|nr:hypothetical protein [Candidatus Pullilachnospira intestinigallinarum]